jgi:hypothetical protein
MNCRNCGAAPNGKARCAYCGTVDFEQVRYLVSCRAEEAEAAMKAIVSLGATGYACVPNDVAIQMLRLNPPILRAPARTNVTSVAWSPALGLLAMTGTPTPGEKMTV